MHRWLTALLVYVLIVAVIVLTKPALMFDAAGNPKIWGARNDETTSVFAPAFALPFLALLVYYFVCVANLARAA